MVVLAHTVQYILDCSISVSVLWLFRLRHNSPLERRLSGAASQAHSLQAFIAYKYYSKYFMMAVDPLTHSPYPSKSKFSSLTSRETLLTTRNAIQILTLSKTPHWDY